MDAACPDELFDQIVDMTRELQSLTQVGDWEAATALERQRQGLIEVCFHERARFADTQRARRVIQTVLAADQEVLANSARAREEMARQLSDLRRRRSANDAYQRFSK